MQFLACLSFFLGSVKQAVKRSYFLFEKLVEVVEMSLIPVAYLPSLRFWLGVYIEDYTNS